MRWVYVCVFLFFVPASQVVAQQATTGREVSAREYIESTSPLRGGGTVTSRSQPGSDVQTVTSIANLPVVDRPGSTNRNSTTAPTYPYPGASPVARTAAASVRPQTAYRQATAYQVPTLGLTPLARTAQNCNCAPAPPRTFQPQNYAAAGYAPQVAVPAANQVPALPSLGVPDINIQVPGQNGFAPQGFQTPGFQSGTQTYTPNYALQSGIGTPQFNGGGYGATGYGGGGSSWLTPFVSGRGQYPSLLSFRNLPPGTYLGQGIIGQPTAYVDGQVLRNLLRYFTP